MSPAWYWRCLRYVEDRSSRPWSSRRLLLAPAVLIGSWLGNHQGLVYNGFDVVKAFPLMAIATGVVLVLGLVRIIAQPIRRAPKKAANRQAANA